MKANLNNVVARLTEGAASTAEDTAKFGDYFVSEKQHKLCKSLAVAMRQCNWTTTQREDAEAIAANAKVSESDALAMVDNLISFSQEVVKELRNIKKSIKAT